MADAYKQSWALKRLAAIRLAMTEGSRHERHQILQQVILEEYKRARTKFPPMHSTHEGYGIILEELDEAWDEIKANQFEASCDEMIQVAAMALAYLVDLTDPERSK
jgi:hypothetical protein